MIKALLIIFSINVGFISTLVDCNIVIKINWNVLYSGYDVEEYENLRVIDIAITDDTENSITLFVEEL